jgi:hypothetical protein
MDQTVNICGNPDCTKPLTTPRKLKLYCSYACRGQHKALLATTHRSGLSGAKNTKRNRALRSLKQASRAGFSFCKINSITYRLDTRNKRGAGWLMDVAWLAPGSQRWVARVGNHASEPLSLGEAKKAAVAMLGDRSRPEARDWIAQLNQQAADEVDRTAREEERNRWPIDLLGGCGANGLVEPGLRAAILDAKIGDGGEAVTEPLQGDDYPLEYYDDGYPVLPPCLVRRTKR